MIKRNQTVNGACVVITALFISLLSVAVKAQGHSSQAFTSKEGAFSITLPEAPNEKSEPMTSNNGPTTLHTFTVERNEGQSFLMVGYSDYQTRLDVEGTLTGVINGQVDSLKGKITSDKPVTLDGHPGRLVTIETAGAVFYSKIYVAENRLYQVMFGTAKALTQAAELNEGFESFHILM
jgi:hypothetical protein